MRALLIRPDGTTEPAELPDGSDGQDGPAIAAAIGADLFNRIRVLPDAPGRPGVTMWVDDLGVSLHLEVNHVATALYAELAAHPVAQILRGPALVTGDVRQDGVTTGLTDGQVTTLADMATAWRLKFARASELSSIRMGGL